eukprot:11553891-Alexandrium_andersonii.AAC.1
MGLLGAGLPLGTNTLPGPPRRANRCERSGPGRRIWRTRFGRPLMRGTRMRGSAAPHWQRFLE